MKNIFKVSDGEKNRIRNLHLTESGNKKISSRLNEQESMGVNVDEPKMGDKDISTQIEPVLDGGPESSVMPPAHYHVLDGVETEVK